MEGVHRIHQQSSERRFAAWCQVVFAPYRSRVPRCEPDQSGKNFVTKFSVHLNTDSRRRFSTLCRTQKQHQVSVSCLSRKPQEPFIILAQCYACYRHMSVKRSSWKAFRFISRITCMAIVSRETYGKGLAKPPVGQIQSLMQPCLISWAGLDVATMMDNWVSKVCCETTKRF